VKEGILEIVGKMFFVILVHGFSFWLGKIFENLVHGELKPL
jgi:hypothetical protein